MIGLLIGALLAVLTMLSVVEGAINQLSLLTLRVFAERWDEPRYQLFDEIAADRRHFLIPIQFGIQLLLVTLAVLVGWVLHESGWRWPLLLSLGCVVLIIVFFRQVIPYLITVQSPERVLLALIPRFNRFYRLLSWISFPVTFTFRTFRSNQERRTLAEADDEDATDEEIQAYLDVGEEEGIFDETGSRLIQSALEFGSTLVREIMTPRSDMVAVDESATLAEVRELIVSTKHSRVPVYKEQKDQIVGIVYVRNLLSLLEAGHENDPITPIVTEVPLVPETKNVAELLKEMQAHAEQMAIVVNEYGTVSGLVTVEDLLEEIVGEIADEDETRDSDLVYEGEGHYVVTGGLEVTELEKALDVEYGEHEASTVSGLVVNHLGEVPPPGETLLLDGTMIEVLSSDDRRIHKLRIRTVEDSEE
ncbi:MAG: HlyC/CorC family transporter [Acidobacteriota bacterium]|nr:MAG: HlyC/CorC family transporter [Acidobacteriota bacterium]